MLKVMIVEDEPLIRAGLKHYFPWEQLGVGGIVEAENGKAGVDVALREEPDLIVTDIRMPEMNGLEMIEQLKPLLPNASFIILTGYNEFKYAQEAIRLGVVQEYLLKPLEYDVSMEAITACINRLEQKREERRKKREFEAKAAELTKWQYGQAVKQLMDGSLSDIPGWRQLLGFNEQSELTYVTLAASCFGRSGLQQERKWRQTAEQLIGKAAAEISPGHRLMGYMSRGRLYVLLVLAGLSDPSGADQLLSRRLSSSLNPIHPDTRLYLSVGPATSDLAKAGAALKSAGLSLLQRFASPGQWLISADHLPADEAPAGGDRFVSLHPDDRKKLQACLEQGDSVAAGELMDRLCEQSEKALPHIQAEQWLVFLQEIINVTLRFAHKEGIPVQGVSSEKLLDLSFVHDYRTLKSLFEYLALWVVHLNDVYSKQTHQSSQENAVFNQIKGFIEKNIDQELSLQMVADHFFYNPSYLSRLFKSKLNQNYLSFVTEIRIDYAKKLLRDTNRLVTDVCTMCGYKSYKHFVKMFRLVAGTTPTDYRRQLGIMH
ncbi:response regulator transcription factor [Paenibacillus sp. JDR-2]|uniref:response regulator transcription factor n=1 Tax=Paenibacillus sp. (strain JDR-2) TaxID=324057 RepID=UPI000166AF64|nr:response regulator [Paenibacillus sp. JDR-2]ACT04806.1 two component transcriptional regulator, AraC family [Paenibacillus sp. JDR-2]